MFAPMVEATQKEEEEGVLRLFETYLGCHITSLYWPLGPALDAINDAYFISNNVETLYIYAHLSLVSLNVSFLERRAFATCQFGRTRAIDAICSPVTLLTS